MGASANVLSKPDSSPSPSHTAYTVEIGRIEAANREALNSPPANNRYAYSPARGRSACAALAASLPCTVNKLDPGHAARSYSRNKPPRRSRRFTVIGEVPFEVSIGVRPFGGSSPRLL